MNSRRHYLPIEDHGVIGNLNTVALVGVDGAIDFLCFPYFDSPSVFARLLDREKGGCFQLAPALERARPKQLYLPDSNILLTRFLSDDGVGEISDYMPVHPPWPVHGLIRRAKAVRGDIRFRMVCAPRFDYGRARHQVIRGDGCVYFVADEQPGLRLRLRSTVPLQLVKDDAVAEFTLRVGQAASFVLERMEADETAHLLQEGWLGDCFKDTLNFWRGWIERSKYRGRWREIVNRSALILKLLTSAQHGSMVAAPTFGLPERIGGGRNWDYRYTWIRDSSFALDALMHLGFTDEARAFFRWLDRSCCQPAEAGPLQVLYGLDGRRTLTEECLSHLEGYRGSHPVRIGNAAYNQLQFDIYGELIDAMVRYDEATGAITFDAWTRIREMVDWVCAHWREPDEGIWEVRGGRQEFLFSRVMNWVALDRAGRLAERRRFPAPTATWVEVRQQIHHDIMTHFWNADMQSFVQYKGGAAVDASSLLMPILGLITPSDNRWFQTLYRIEETLVDDALVYRYERTRSADDGLKGGEGTFTTCSFWYAECVARSGDAQKARLLFEKTLGYANHLGLYAEELGPRGEHLGNFPQALTHLALISAARQIDRGLDRDAREPTF